METITIIADGDKVSVETKGFKGKGCIKITEELEQFLGNKPTTTKTAEFYMPEVPSGRQVKR